MGRLKIYIFSYYCLLWAHVMLVGNFNMNLGTFLSVYVNYGLFLILIVSFIVILLILPTVLGIFYKTFSSETETAYECGFVPFSEGQVQFTITFYVVSVLFILFDLEVVFLFPLLLGLLQQTIISFCVAFLFLMVLGIGFIVEFQILSD